LGEMLMVKTGVSDRQHPLPIKIEGEKES
jgi:hypothetical protein